MQASDSRRIRDADAKAVQTLESLLLELDTSTNAECIQALLHIQCLMVLAIEDVGMVNAGRRLRNAIDDLANTARKLAKNSDEGTGR